MRKTEQTLAKELADTWKGRATIAAGMRIGTVMLIGMLFCWTLDAQAQSGDAATADAAFREGRRLMDEGKYAEACAQFEASEQLDPALGTVMNLGDCYAKLGRTATAWARFNQAADLAQRQRDDREKTARERAAELEPRLRRLVIAVPAAARVTGLEVRRDGRVVNPMLYGKVAPIDPGDHVIAANAPRFVTWSSTVPAPAEGETMTVEIPTLTVDRSATPIVVRIVVRCGEDGKILAAGGFRLTADGVLATAEPNVSGRPDGAEFHLPRGYHRLRIVAAGCAAYEADLDASDAVVFSGTLVPTRTFGQQVRHFDGPGASRSSHVALALGFEFPTYTIQYKSSAGEQSASRQTPRAILSVIYSWRWLEVALDAAKTTDIEAKGKQVGARAGVRLPLVYGSISGGFGVGATSWDKYVPDLTGHVFEGGAAQLSWEQADLVVWGQAELRPICHVALGVRAGLTKSFPFDNVTSTSDMTTVENQTNVFVGVYLAAGLSDRREIIGLTFPVKRIFIRRG